MGVMERSPISSAGPLQYRLTERGRDLYPVFAKPGGLGRQMDG